MAWPRTEDTRAEHGLVTPTSQHTLATDNSPRRQADLLLGFRGQFRIFRIFRHPNFSCSSLHSGCQQTAEHTAAAHSGMMDGEQISRRRWSWCGCSVWSLGACVDFNISRYTYSRKGCVDVYFASTEKTCSEHQRKRQVLHHINDTVMLIRLSGEILNNHY